MKCVSFVLKDEDLYQIWVETAERLQFDSMDETGSRAATTSKQSSAHPPKASEWDNSDKDRQTSKQETAHSPKASKSGGAEDDRHGSNEKAGKKVIDASRKTDPEPTTDPARGRSIVAQPEPDEVDDAVDDDARQTRENKTKKSTRYAVYTAESMVFLIFSIKKTPINRLYSTIENCSIFQYSSLIIVY